MRNPLKTDRSTGLGLLAIRLPIGVFFLVLGYVKLHGGLDSFVNQHISDVPGPVPREWGLHYLQAIPFAEMAAGAMLVFGLFTRLAGFIGAVMVTTFTIAITGWKGTPPQPFNPNIIYIGVLLAIFLVGPGKLSIDGVLFKKKTLSSPAD